MAETQQVRDNSSNKEEESPEPEMSQSHRRFKASNMTFVKMVEMVDILKRADYDGKYGSYLNPNVRKAKIMTKVVKSLHRNFGVRQSKEQLRKRWSDLRLREHDQYRIIKKVLLKSKYLSCVRILLLLAVPCAFPPEEGEQRTPQPEDVEEGEVVEIVTTTGDVHVVEEQSTHFTTDGEQRLIHDTMQSFCSQDLGLIKQKTNDIEQKLKNMIDVLGRI
ncbi:hypothetical protein AB205_0122400 [Aquarana catesbeiana]|uniref:Uncharacterized protein n=1 Tax=Aquarana catesbeiana TaxID=8400 RepID=A0A2G9SN58_AQUCT|nr:hypothetical protein AB205_0122400 [Aquarana catesbeiana]